MPQIEIIISPQGQAQVQTTGFSGATCQVASRFVEQALGLVSSDELTSEFHQIEILQQAAESERHHL